MSFLDSLDNESLEGHKSALKTLIENAEADVKKWKDEIGEVDSRLRPAKKEEKEEKAKPADEAKVEPEPVKEEKEEVVKEEVKTESELPKKRTTTKKS